MEKFLRLFYVDTLAICRSLSKPLITMVQGYAREAPALWLLPEI